jgi:hypothetical protein
MNKHDNTALYVILTVILIIVLLHPLASKGSEIMPTTTPTAAIKPTVPVYPLGAATISPTLNHLGVAQIMQGLGLSQANALTFANIVGAESSGNASTINDKTLKTGEYSVGLAQINIGTSLANGAGNEENLGLVEQMSGLSGKALNTLWLQNPINNLTVAAALFKTSLAAGTGGFKPWSTYSNGQAALYANKDYTVNTGNPGAPMNISQNLSLLEGKAEGAQNAAQGAVSAVGNALNPATWLAPIETWISKAIHPTVMFIVGILLVVFGLIVISKSQIETVTELAAPETIPAVETEKKLTKGKGK